MDRPVEASRVVLASHHHERLFREAAPAGVHPLYYRYRDESFPQKVLRKLGWRAPCRTFHDKFEVVGREKGLQDVSTLWLSSPLYLEPPVMRCLLDVLPKLEWVYSQLTGTEHLELLDFKRRGVMVSNSGDLVSRAVAETALACILSHAKRLPDHHSLQRRRRWRSLWGGLVGEQTVGIVGTGNIGNELARLCRALGMRVIGASRNPGRLLGQREASPYHHVVDVRNGLQGLLAEADHVVLALPLNGDTQGIIGARELASMKPAASLINVARGLLVDEGELCEALSQGTIAAAYIDRTTQLPPPWWSRLYRTPNLHLTHYSAANTPRVAEKAFEVFLLGIHALDEGREPLNRVV